jgi:hypothetical protein
VNVGVYFYAEDEAPPVIDTAAGEDDGEDEPDDDGHDESDDDDSEDGPAS